MLELKDVSVRFESRQALNRVSFSLREQAMTVMVGRNGSGKSTMLGCVNRQIPYTGQILLDGTDLALIPPRGRAGSVAILPQSVPSPHITARELVSFGRNPYLDFTGRLTEADRQAVEQALRDADVLDLAQRYVDTLSGGEKQRVLLAMLLAQNAPIALLDEPTAHLDPGNEAAFLELLQKMKKTRQKTFLVILHDLNLAVEYADDLIVLDGGELVFAGSREDCLAKQVLEKNFALRRHRVSDGDRERYFFSVK